MRTRRWMRGLGAALLAYGLGACAHAGHTVAPYRDDARAAGDLQDRARRFCMERRGEAPPHVFLTDGCSAFPNDGWAECCVEHDIAYWCGGSADERSRADRRLQSCIAERGHPRLGRLMYLGVRAGGVPWVPVHWRWGFGWDFPQPDGGATHAAQAPLPALEESR